jgi:beta-galactosidase
MGVGGDDGWGARPHPEYTLESQPYSYSFRLRAYVPDMGSPDELASQNLPEL